MIYIYGDSHGRFNMANFQLQHINHSQDSITMHRIGRDCSIVNFTPECIGSKNITLLFYGEVDCRCHIGRQVALGRNLNDIIDELVKSYIDTIRNSIPKFKHIIIGSITPPMKKELYEAKHGAITHEFPFVGSDQERVFYTKTVNSKLAEYCKQYGFLFLDTYDYYANPDGTLKYELSDTIVHIQDNSYIHRKLLDLVRT